MGAGQQINHDEAGNLTGGWCWVISGMAKWRISNTVIDRVHDCRFAAPT